MRHIRPGRVAGAIVVFMGLLAVQVNAQTQAPPEAVETGAKPEGAPQTEASTPGAPVSASDAPAAASDAPGTASGGAGTASSAPAGTPASIEALDQRVKILERLRELEREAAAEKAKTTPVVAAGKDGFVLRSADSAFALKLRGYVHFDGRFFSGDDERPLFSTFLLRRVRPIVEGTLFKFIDFRIMPDFGAGTTVLQDAYADFKFSPGLVARVGKDKPPVGLERLQSAQDIVFVERALPTNLVPNRDSGVQLSGELGKGVFTYAAGLFNGVVDGGNGDLDNGDGKDFAARIFATPFKNGFSVLKGLGVGFALSTGNQEGTTALPGLPIDRSPGQQTFFNYLVDGTAAGTTIADGSHERYSPQAYFYSGSLGILAEYVISKQEVVRGAAAADLEHTSWQIAANYILTGQNAQFRGGVSPTKVFDPSVGTWGAFEVAARYSVLEIDEDTFPTFADPGRAAGKAKAYGAGLNWYWNKNVKLLFDYEHTDYEGGASGGDREPENAILTRVQIAY